MSQLISPGDIIVVSWRNFRRNFHSYAELVLWGLVLSLLQWTLSVVLQAYIPEKLPRLLIYTLLSIPGSLGFLVIYAATIDLTIRSLSGERTQVNESLKRGLKRLLPMLWVSILTSLVIFGGFLLVIVPALIFLIWFRFAPYQVMDDEGRGTKALAASRHLVTGRWFSVLLRAAVPFLFFAIAASFARMMVYLLIGGLLGDPRLFFGQVMDTSQLSSIHTLITAIVPQITDGLALALFLGADVALWLDLRRKG